MTIACIENQPTTITEQRFVRDHLTWLYYGLVGLNCYIASALGPIMPFLRSELALNYRVAGLHFSAFALGTVLAGSFGERLTSCTGQVKTLWIGVGGTIVGLLLLITAHQPSMSISGIALAGFASSLTYQTLATVMTAHLGELRTFAFMEAEFAAMLVAGLAPLAVSFFVSVELGWRAAIISLIVFFIASCPFLKKFKSVEEKHINTTAKFGKLPKLFWNYALIIFLSVSAEWSTAFWSADYLHYRLSMTKASAAGAVGAFFLGMILGRFSGSRLVRKYSTSTLLAISGYVSILGFLMFWLGASQAISVLGLFFTGLGIANLYPLSFSEAIAAAPSLAGKAIARISLTCGVAVMTTPLVLSFISDKAGLFTAYAVVTALLLLCLIAIAAANIRKGASAESALSASKSLA